MATPAPTPQDLLLLSAYLDGQISPSARAALEERLAADPALRALLEDLRATRAVLRAAPTLRPPRDFTLDPALYGRATPFWARGGLFRVAGLVGAAAAAVLIAFGALFMGNQAAAPGSAARNVVAATATAAVGVAAVPTQIATLTETPDAAAFSAPLPTAALIATSAAAEPPSAATSRSAPPATIMMEMAVTAQVEMGPAAGLMAATPAIPSPISPPTSALGLPTATFAETAAEPTQADAVQQVSPATPPATTEGLADEGPPINPASRLIAVIGISLLILSGVVFLIGWFRARQQ